MGKELPKRKIIRLQGYDYSNAGCYFITICVKDRHEILGQIVGTTAPGRPIVELTPLGICVNETIQIANNNNVKIDKYVIMPNHIHMIIILKQRTDDIAEQGKDDIAEQGTDDRGRSSLQQVVRNIKSYVTKWAGFSLWQPRFHDHIIRNADEYNKIWQYIDENPQRWQEDRYYIKI